MDGVYEEICEARERKAWEQAAAIQEAAKAVVLDAGARGDGYSLVRSECIETLRTALGLPSGV